MREIPSDANRNMPDRQPYIRGSLGDRLMRGMNPVPNELGGSLGFGSMSKKNRYRGEIPPTKRGQTRMENTSATGDNGEKRPEPGLPTPMKPRLEESEGRSPEPLRRPHELRASAMSDVPYQAGIELQEESMATEYSQRFWERLDEGTDREEKKRQMRIELKEAVKNSLLVLDGAVDADGNPTEESKEMLAAYASLGKDVGFTVGPFERDPMMEEFAAQIQWTYAVEPTLPGGPMMALPRKADDPILEYVFQEEIYTDGLPGRYGDNRRGWGSKDGAYSELFWQYQHPPNKKDDMVNTIVSACVRDGIGEVRITVPTNTEGKLTQMGKGELSAYRVLAEKEGYRMGEYKKDPETGEYVAGVASNEYVKSLKGQVAAENGVREVSVVATADESNEKHVGSTEAKKLITEMTPGPFSPEEVGQLKGIYEKCTAKNDKGEGAMFISPTREKKGNFVAFSDEEVSTMGKLIGEARRVHESFTTQEPQWDTFQTLLEKRRRETGAMGEVSAIVVDNQTTVPYEDKTPERGSVLKVPENVHRLYNWETTIKDCADALALYKKGLADGGSAKYFGRDVKAVYKFVNEGDQIINSAAEPSEQQ